MKFLESKGYTTSKTLYFKTIGSQNLHIAQRLQWKQFIVNLSVVQGINIGIGKFKISSS